MSYLTNFIKNLSDQRKYKKSCTKTGLIPMKILVGLVRIMKFLRIYDTVFYLSLISSNIINKKKLLNFYSQFVKEGDLCFDIGANLGYKTEAFLKLGAKVVAVEPQDVCIKKLRKKYGKNKNVFLVQKAISDKEGEEKLMVSDSHVVSSMSKKWIKNLKKSDMFFVSTSAPQWQKSVKVKTTTLDKLIKDYGKPCFCKIDIEGYEYKALKGLSKPIETISFEFTPTPELIPLTINTINHLSTIGNVKFNYSLGSFMALELKKWIGAKEISKILSELPQKTSFSGDVFAKFY